MRLPPLVLLLAATCATGTVRGQVSPYNPYADAAEAPPPLAADGTIHWGTFYKSAALQKTYERLWNLGACRGSNRAITVPVAENKLVIDRLPEAEFKGVVRAAAGPIAGGMVAFAEGVDTAASAEPFVAQFHPAGVTRFAVRGSVPAAVLAPGMTVRLRAAVDTRGRSSEAVRAFEIVTPPRGFAPDAILPDRVNTIVGTVVGSKKDVLTLRVDAGRIRRLSLPLADDAVASIDAAAIELVSPGDAIEAKGRLWTGEGSMGSGTVFVSDVIVTKNPVAATPAEQAPGPKTVGVR
jgi:hypothetical protein